MLYGTMNGYGWWWLSAAHQPFDCGCRGAELHNPTPSASPPTGCADCLQLCVFVGVWLQWGELYDGVVEHIVEGQGLIMRLLPNGPSGRLPSHEISQYHIHKLGDHFKPGDGFKVGSLSRWLLASRARHSTRARNVLL